MTGYLVRFILICTLVCVLACGGGAESGGQMYTSRDEALAAAHPRLILTEKATAALKDKLDGSHAWLWQRCEQDISARIAAVRRDLIKTDELDRGLAGTAQETAFIWKMTGRKEHFEAARDHLLALAGAEAWPPENDLIHGHLLQSMALAYDWLYPRLSEHEREVVSRRLKQEAENQYERMTTGRVWYRNQYYQNHGISNHCGLAYAACALWGEDERAARWLAVAEEFLDIAETTMPADGTSLEGISYGAYDFEYLVRYAALARELLDRDYTDTEGLKNFPLWVLHSMLPRQEPAAWAMTFGDAPRHVNWHGPEAQLIWSATNYKDGVAQWLARKLIELEPEGLGSASWWSLLFYDNSVPETDPLQAGVPKFHHFTENDQVAMRSSWDDSLATLVGLKAGPFMGRTMSEDAKWDWGTNHQQPDAGSFQLFSRGTQLAIDPGYTIFKRTANHNTMLFKGIGQLGDDVPWMGVAECLEYHHYPHIVHTAAESSYDYVVADMKRAYHPALNLRGYERHYLYLKPDILLVADEFSLGADGAVYSYPSKVMELSGGLSFGWADYVVGTGGQATVTFEGQAGEYRIAVNYLDNYPGEGTFAVEVDGKQVHEWQTTNRDTDNHYILTPPVQLKPGSKIAFVGQNMPHNCRLIRMAASGREAQSERSARWILHTDKDAQVALETMSARACIVSGQAALDVYALSPDAKAARVSSEDWEVLEPDAEVDATKRISLEPVFDSDRVVLIEMLRARDAASPGLGDLVATLDDSGENLKATINWTLDGKQTVLSWDLRGRTIELK